MISQIQAAVSAVMSNRAAAPTTVGTGDPPAVDKTQKQAEDKASFSILASQLNERAVRAAKRDAGMTFEELGQYGRHRIKEFTEETSQSNSSTRAMEVPKTQDPELLDRARAASAFVTRTLAGDKTAISPFEKLSREQLNLVAYDDSGAFTLNERRAAWQGVQKMDEAWRKVAIPSGMLEQIRTGKASRFYNDALSYFKSLPAIEKAVDYPKNAQATLEARIKDNSQMPSLDIAAKATPGISGIFSRDGGSRKLTLYDILAGGVDTQKSKAESNGLPPGTRFSPRTSPTPVSWNERWARKEAAAAAKAVSTMQVTAPTMPSSTAANAPVKTEAAGSNKTTS